MSPARKLLSKRGEPKQDRAAVTIERILDATAELLASEGFEGVSTNLICKHAGLTPPALYRYFPNKHAVLKELGERLLDAQNAALKYWADELYDEKALVRSFVDLMEGQVAATADQPHADWILRSLYASPILIDVRLASHHLATKLLTDKMMKDRAGLNRKAVYRHNRLSVEIGYSALEMLADEPKEASYLIKETARMLAARHAEFIGVKLT